MIQVSERMVRVLLELRRDKKAILCVVLAMCDSTEEAIRRLEEVAQIDSTKAHVDIRLALEAALLAADLLPWAEQVKVAESGGR